MSAKDKIWRYLSEHNWQATNGELGELLKGQKGQQSFGQRIRELRKAMYKRGGDIECKELRTGSYLYRVIWPEPKRTQNEQAVAENNLAQENKINRECVGVK
jgi:hypothetical protein